MDVQEIFNRYLEEQEARPAAVVIGRISASVFFVAGDAVEVAAPILPEHCRPHEVKMCGSWRPFVEFDGNEGNGLCRTLIDQGRDVAVVYASGEVLVLV